jgi:hypothetical protein
VSGEGIQAPDMLDVVSIISNIKPVPYYEIGGEIIGDRRNQ